MTKEHGSHHALDLYSTIAMMTESDWNRSKEMAAQNSNSTIGQEASRIVAANFDSSTSRGMLVMRSNPYCTDDLQLDEFMELLKQLF